MTRFAHAWQSLYPPLQGHDHGWLDAGDGHQLYWEESGNPLGVPALFVHGGPGAGCNADDRRWFDPQRYRIVLFDQRGCGRSNAAGELCANNTAHLVADIELLRNHLHVDRWMLFGGSWGATLALAYAQRFPSRVRALVLRGVFTATRQEQQWLYGDGGAAALLPLEWQQLLAGAFLNEPDSLLEAFAARLHSGNTGQEHAAAFAWLQWEQDLMDSEAPPAVAQSMRKPTTQKDGAAAVRMARLGVHYARNAFFLEDGELISKAPRLRTVPGVIVQGLRDLVTPPAAAEALHQAWPGSRLDLINAAGHASSHPAMARQLIAATDFFADIKTMTTETGHERFELER